MRIGVNVSCGLTDASRIMSIRASLEVSLTPWWRRGSIGPGWNWRHPRWGGLPAEAGGLKDPRIGFYGSCALCSTEASLAKLCPGDWGAGCLDQAIQIHGGMGETLELPLTLFYCLLRHAQVGGGTSEIHRMLIARSLLR
jgi:alkylation response protein AidB-like acyl-CoA dehydrogenase